MKATIIAATFTSLLTLASARSISKVRSAATVTPGGSYSSGPSTGMGQPAGGSLPAYSLEIQSNDLGTWWGFSNTDGTLIVNLPAGDVVQMVSVSEPSNDSAYCVVADDQGNQFTSFGGVSNPQTTVNFSPAQGTQVRQVSCWIGQGLVY